MQLDKQDDDWVTKNFKNDCNNIHNSDGEVDSEKFGIHPENGLLLL